MLRGETPPDEHHDERDEADYAPEPGEIGAAELRRNQGHPDASGGFGEERGEQADERPAHPIEMPHLPHSGKESGWGQPLPVTNPGAPDLMQ